MRVVLGRKDREALMNTLPLQIQKLRDGILHDLQSSCCVDDDVRDYVNTMILRSVIMFENQNNKE